jgi:hypothetical protein
MRLCSTTAGALLRSLSPIYTRVGSGILPPVFPAKSCELFYRFQVDGDGKRPTKRRLVEKSAQL